MKLIINADDFGMSKTVNEAIVEGYNNGILSSTCIMANMPAFEQAVKSLEKMPNIGLGIHLNIIEKKTLLQTSSRENGSKLYDKDGKFYNGFLQMIIKSFDDDFMVEVEHEFRTQIEAVLKYAKPDHIDSHVHTHAIPKIFELVCKLAKEYDIPRVRTQFEYPYLAKNHRDWFNPKYYINLIKIFILNVFTVINRGTLYKYGLKSNDRVIGVGYTGMMDKDTILSGIEASKDCDCVLEVICHPDLNEDRVSNRNEYFAVTDKELQDKIKEYNVITYRDI
ncbi:MAG: carbohydrate deacetylase [Candidatus Gastranaerophilaceae bacterium]